MVGRDRRVSYTGVDQSTPLGTPATNVSLVENSYADSSRFVRDWGALVRCVGPAVRATLRALSAEDAMWYIRAMTE